MGLKEAVVFKVARRWISGQSLDSGIRDAKEARAKGFAVILNYLGEDVAEPAAAQKQFEEYVRIQQAIHEAGIDGSASAKLTQFGLVSGATTASQRAEELASRADSLGQPFWIDMEGSRFTSQTIEIYLGLLEKHRTAGLAVQAYMHRSEADLAVLLEKGARIRLVKGAYKEEHNLVYSSSDEIRRSFSKLMVVLFEKGDNFAIATHDSTLVEEARRLSETYNKKFEFAMLRGIRDELKRELVESGYRVVEYIPYGDQWYAYSMRRMREHPSNAWLLLRSLV